MFFNFGISNKTVQELRKNQGYTAKELAQRVKVEVNDILLADKLKLKDVAEPLRTKITPFLNGDQLDKIPCVAPNCLH